eukprot:3309269-Rhodomonas_salina.2
MGPVAFVSHQWLAWEHADPEFEQLKVLQRVLCRIWDGEINGIGFDWLAELAYAGKDKEAMKVDNRDLSLWITTGYIWFDFFSIPQNVGYDLDAGADLMNAINSIPAYVQMCRHFIMLCPPLEHKNTKDGQFAAVCDMSSWAQRGWCSAEVSVQLLTRPLQALIRIDSAEGTLGLVGSYSAWFSPAGHGEFTCCSRQHLFPRKDPVTGNQVLVQVPCDKMKVAAVLNLLIDRTTEDLQNQLAEANEKTARQRHNTLFQLRWTKAIRAHMLSNLELPGTESKTGSEEAGVNAVQQDVMHSDFMHLFHFDTSSVNGTAEDWRSGWTPLRYAVICDNRAAAQVLLQRGADVEATLKQDYVAITHSTGMNVLHTACDFGSKEMMTLLLSHGANPLKMLKQELTGVDCCCLAGNVEALRVLLDHCQQDHGQFLRKKNEQGIAQLGMAARFANGIQAGACAGELLQRLQRDGCSTSEFLHALEQGAQSEYAPSKILELLLERCREDVVDSRTQ